MENKNSKILGVVVVSFVVVLVVFVYWFFGKKQVYKEVKETENLVSVVTTSEDGVQNSENVDSTATSSDMYLYTNEKYGFSLQVPKQVSNVGIDCGEKTLPTKVFDIEGGIYISSEYFFQYNPKTNTCDKTDNSIESMSEPEKIYVPNWKFVVKEINSDIELENFLKERYGNGCIVGEQKLTTQNGVFDVFIQADGKDPAETECFVNYVTAIKYYPEKHKVVSWNLGQEPTFWKYDPVNTVPGLDPSYDADMLSSFRFIE